MERLLSRREAADLLRVPPATLAGWAYKRSGPKFYRVGRFALYSERDLTTWLEQRVVETGGVP
jgi:hypothetical protein